jgi:hypothetical protein
LGLGALFAALTACGGSGASPKAPETTNTTSGPVVAGTVSSSALTSVSVKDSSVPAQQKTVSTDGSGRFSVDVSGMTPPFMLRASDASGDALYAVAEQAGTANIDAVTSAAVALASDDGSADDAWAATDGAAAKNFQDAIGKVKAALAVLFQHYGVTFDDGREQSAPFKTMLSQTSLVVSAGALTVTNTANGSVVFTAPMKDLSSGVFHAENMPGGITFEKDVDPIFTRVFSTVPAPGTCYSCHSKGLPTSDDVPFVFTSPADPVTDYQTIISNGLVNTSDPASSLLYVKPTGQVDHGGDKVFPPSSPEAQVILTWIKNGALAASAPGPAPMACTYTYSDWSACQADNTQTRTVTASSPAGCTGTPVLTQACSSGTPMPMNPVTQADVVASCTGCHGLTSNTTLFKAGGYTITGRSSAQWLITINNMVNLGSQLAPGTAAQNYADYLAGVP